MEGTAPAQAANCSSTPPPSPGSFRYSRDLQSLNRARRPEVPVLRMALDPIFSPLRERLPEWRNSLRCHRDTTFRDYVVEGLEHGFQVGFDHSSHLVSAQRNMPSAAEHFGVIDAYIKGEVTEGRMMGPFPKGSLLGIHINCMGVIPKCHFPGKWRLITDLSAPAIHYYTDH